MNGRPWPFGSIEHGLYQLATQIDGGVWWVAAFGALVGAMLVGTLTIVLNGLGLMIGGLLAGVRDGLRLSWPRALDWFRRVRPRLPGARGPASLGRWSDAGQSELDDDTPEWPEQASVGPLAAEWLERIGHGGPHAGPLMLLHDEAPQVFAAGPCAPDNSPLMFSPDLQPGEPLRPWNSRKMPTSAAMVRRRRAQQS